NPAEEDVPARVKELTGGRGADVVLEAVGQESSFQAAFELVRRGGTVSMVGVPQKRAYEFPIRQAFNQDITFKVGLCNAKRYMAQVIPLVQQGKLDPTGIITHTLSLAEADRAYDIFANKKDGCIKVLLRP
ncbi:MAG TPA: zinc-binding dehydrogenase, partial [Dehalococcoidia bacterium]|nr:zinc-binding dehydrogenase [Dehalococcoidia bacterium]